MEAAQTTSTTPETPRPATISLSVTPKAAQKAREALVRRGTPNGMLRLGVKGGGCSGFSYVLEFAEEARLKDQTFEFHGLKVIVDPKSLVFLNGCTLDYEVKLMQQGFKFVNPNEKTGCGCGESFSV